MARARGAVLGDRAVVLGEQLAVEQQEHAGAEPEGGAVAPARDPAQAERLAVEAQRRVALGVRVGERGLEDPGDAVHQGPSRSITQPSPSRV